MNIEQMNEISRVLALVKENQNLLGYNGMYYKSHKETKTIYRKCIIKSFEASFSEMNCKFKVNIEYYDPVLDVWAEVSVNLNQLLAREELLQYITEDLYVITAM